MQDAIDRVMITYSMIANLSLEKESDLRQAVTAHLSKFPETDADAFAVEGLRFARQSAA